MESTMDCPACGQEIDASEPTCPACGHIHSGTMQCERHPDRQAVAVCVICGQPVCDECDNESARHHACPAHASVPVVEGWAQVYSTSDTFEGNLISENLQAEGIDSEILSQKDRSFNVDMGDLSPVRVLVPAYAYNKAMTLLTSHMDLSGEVMFACPSCGEAFEAGDTNCRSCGTPLPTAAGGRRPDAG